MVYVLLLYVVASFYSPNISYKVFTSSTLRSPLTESSAEKKNYTKNCNSPLKILFTTKAAAPTSCACLPK